jgi:hypothetical protein
MIEDGLFEKFPCEAIFGMHNRANLPIGHFTVRSGPMMAGGAFFDICIIGTGDHGAAGNRDRPANGRIAYCNRVADRSLAIVPPSRERCGIHDEGLDR